jgi:predicted DNA binding CopG/RHH family protein
VSVAKKWTDPYDDMSDDEFDAHVEKLFSKRPRAVGVSLRMPPDLLERIKRQAGRAGVPYQTFMKSVVEAAVTRLERGTSASNKNSRLTATVTATGADRSGRSRTQKPTASQFSRSGGRRRTSTDTRSTA